jgi:hypothetical protein
VGHQEADNLLGCDAKTEGGFRAVAGDITKNLSAHTSLQ